MRTGFQAFGKCFTPTLCLIALIGCSQNTSIFDEIWFDRLSSGPRPTVWHLDTASREEAVRLKKVRAENLSEASEDLRDSIDSMLRNNPSLSQDRVDLKRLGFKCVSYPELYYCKHISHHSGISLFNPFSDIGKYEHEYEAVEWVVTASYEADRLVINDVIAADLGSELD